MNRLPAMTIYLTIDKDLQVAAYKILEEELASILYTNIINAKDFDASKVTSSKIKDSDL